LGELVFVQKLEHFVSERLQQCSVSGYGLCSKRAYAAEGLLKCNTNLEQHKCSVSEVTFLSPISAFLWIRNQADFVM
jgi:hypothetical protein